MKYVRDPRLAKQPLWVQDEVSRLERRLAELEDAYERATTPPQDSNATLDPYSDFARSLPANPMIRHLIDDGNGYLETKFDGRKLTIRGVSNSVFDDFLIVPSLSNEIVIEFRRNNG